MNEDEVIVPQLEYVDELMEKVRKVHKLTCAEMGTKPQDWIDRECKRLASSGVTFTFTR